MHNRWLYALLTVLLRQIATIIVTLTTITIVTSGGPVLRAVPASWCDLRLRRRYCVYVVCVVCVLCVCSGCVFVLSTLIILCMEGVSFAACCCICILCSVHTQNMLMINYVRSAVFHYVSSTEIIMHLMFFSTSTALARCCFFAVICVCIVALQDWHPHIFFLCLYMFCVLKANTQRVQLLRRRFPVWPFITNHTHM